MYNKKWNKCEEWHNVKDIGINVSQSESCQSMLNDIMF